MKNMFHIYKSNYYNELGADKILGGEERMMPTAHETFAGAGE